MSDAFQALKETYFTLDLNFNRLFAACTKDEERDALRLNYVAARNNFLIAQSKILDDDEAMVKQLVSEIRLAQTQIDTELKELQNVAALLGVINLAVNVGSKLTSLAM